MNGNAASTNPVSYALMFDEHLGSSWPLVPENCGVRAATVRSVCPDETECTLRGVTVVETAPPYSAGGTR